MPRKKGVNLFSTPSRASRSTEAGATKPPVRKKARTVPAKQSKASTKTKARPLTASEKATIEGLEEAKTLDSKVRKSSSYADYEKEELLADFEQEVKKNLPLTHELSGEHTIQFPAQHSAMIKRDAKGVVSFEVKYYGRTVGETVLGAMAMLSRLESNLRAYDRELSRKGGS